MKHSCANKVPTIVHSFHSHSGFCLHEEEQRELRECEKLEARRRTLEYVGIQVWQTNSSKGFAKAYHGTKQQRIPGGTGCFKTSQDVAWSCVITVLHIKIDGPHCENMFHRRVPPVRIHTLKICLFFFTAEAARLRVRTSKHRSIKDQADQTVCHSLKILDGSWSMACCAKWLFLKPPIKDNVISTLALILEMSSTHRCKKCVHDMNKCFQKLRLQESCQIDPDYKPLGSRAACGPCHIRRTTYFQVYHQITEQIFQ